MVHANSVVSFCGTEHKNKTSLYSAVCAIRDGSDSTFEASSEELCRILRAAGELPTEPSRTLRLRRMRASVRSSTYYELIADLSDSTSTGISRFRSKRHVASLSSLNQGFPLGKDGTDTARDAE